MFKKTILLTLLAAFSLYGKSEGNEFMPVSEVKSGMKGYGITVVKGTKPVRFDVEIIDVLKDIAPKRSVILAKFSGSNVDKTGIAQGMSGSPIYINGKLVGALAYTWGYLKEAIGGIQPIEEMLPALQLKENKKPEKFKFIALNSELAKQLNIGSADEIMPKKGDFTPISTPLMISGFSPEVFAFFKENFEKYGFTVVQGGGSGKTKSETGADNALNPGDAVGIQMVSGDANMSAIGTVTYKKGNKVLIFGHPFLERGRMAMPLTKAFVHYVLPSLMVSWKMASASEAIGTAYNDTETAVAGQIGEVPATLPVRLTLDKNGEKEVFNYKMVADPLFFPNIFAGLLMSSVYTIDSKMSEGSIECEYVLKIRNLKDKSVRDFVLKDFFIGTNAQALYETALKFLTPLQYIVYNWFDDIKLEGLEVNLKKIPSYQVASVEKIIVQNHEIRPGDIIRMRLFLRLYKGGYVEETVEFQLPKQVSTENDYAYINVSSAKIENLTFVNQYVPRFFPKTFEQLLTMLTFNSSFNHIAIWMENNVSSAVVNGYYLPNLPISKLANYAFREMGNNYLKTRRTLKYIQTNYLITGYVFVPVRIIRD